MAYHEFRTYKPGFPITARRFADFSFHPHWHYEYELILVIAGEIKVNINSISKVLHQGEMAFCSCEDIHQYSDAAPGSEVLIIVFHPDLLADLIDSNLNAITHATFIDSTLIKSLQIPMSEIEAMRDCFLRVHSEMESQLPNYQVFVKSEMLKIMALLLRYTQFSSPVSLVSSTDKSSLKLVKNALHYIELNYKEDITLGQISSYLSFSPFYFSRIFNQVTGLTFKNYLNTVKIEKAQALICSTSRPILQIALDCGFNSVRTFNRVFLSIKGYTPTSLRQDAPDFIESADH